MPTNFTALSPSLQGQTTLSLEAPLSLLVEQQVQTVLVSQGPDAQTPTNLNRTVFQVQGAPSTQLSLPIGAPETLVLASALTGPVGPPGLGTGAGGGVPGRSFWGQALAVTSVETRTLVSIPSSEAGYQIAGIAAHGTGDGYFFAQVGGMTVLSGRIRAFAPVLTMNLISGINVATGTLVVLKVTNESGSTADYEATLIGA